jgi:hypothetical protein
LRDVETLVIDEFHLKIVAPDSPESVLQVSSELPPRLRLAFQGTSGRGMVSRAIDLT